MKMWYNISIKNWAQTCPVLFMQKTCNPTSILSSRPFWFAAFLFGCKLVQMGLGD